MVCIDSFQRNLLPKKPKMNRFLRVRIDSALVSYETSARLREIAPATKGGQDLGSRNLEHILARKLSC